MSKHESVSSTPTAIIILYMYSLHSYVHSTLWAFVKKKWGKVGLALTPCSNWLGNEAKLAPTPKRRSVGVGCYIVDINGMVSGVQYFLLLQ